MSLIYDVMLQYAIMVSSCYDIMMSLHYDVMKSLHHNAITLHHDIIMLFFFTLYLDVIMF